MTVMAVLGRKGRDVVTIDSAASLRTAAEELTRHRIGALVVTDNGRVAGILSERDIIHCLAKHGGELVDLPVSQAMTSEVITADPEMPVLAALGLMTQRRVRHLPVTKGDGLAGIVSIGDLVKHRMERIEAEAEALRIYIQTA